MPIGLYPTQLRSVDAYGSDRYASAINRQSRIISGDQNVILTFDDGEIESPSALSVFPVWYDSSNGISESTVYNYSRYAKVGPGIAIINDVVVHVTADTTTNDGWVYLDVNNADNYLLYPSDDPYPGHPPEDSETAYYLLVLVYNFSRAYPAIQARYFFVKNHDLYWEKKDELIFLAAYGIQRNDSGTPTPGYQIISCDLTLDSNGRVIRRPYPVKFPSDAEYSSDLDGGWVESSLTTPVNIIETIGNSRTDYIRGGYDPEGMDTEGPYIN